jgi:hypothetical protein
VCVYIYALLAAPQVDVIVHRVLQARCRLAHPLPRSSFGLHAIFGFVHHVDLYILDCRILLHLLDPMPVLFGSSGARRYLIE